MRDRCKKTKIKIGDAVKTKIQISLLDGRTIPKGTLGRVEESFAYSNSYYIEFLIYPSRVYKGENLSLIEW